MGDRVIAFVIDGSVEAVMRYDDRIASILLSNPTIVDITDVQVTESWNYSPEKGFYVVIDGEEVVVSV